jgi:hypothetical protein
MSARAVSGWRVTDHVCRVCGGRVLARGPAVRCADCDLEVLGAASALCACGAAPVGTYRCHALPEHVPGSGARVVIRREEGR